MKRQAKKKNSTLYGDGPEVGVKEKSGRLMPQLAAWDQANGDPIK